jgi:exodeoxyribonuclease V alpha subunit
LEVKRRRMMEVFRQAAASKIITGAPLIRQGNMPEPGKAESRSDFHFIEREMPEEIAATLVQDRIPAGHRFDPIRFGSVRSATFRSCAR